MQKETEKKKPNYKKVMLDLHRYQLAAMVVNAVLLLGLFVTLVAQGFGPPV